MKTCTERDQAREVARRWRSQYASIDDSAKSEIGRKLEQMDSETATAADFAKVIGNSSWCKPKTCDECMNASWDVVMIGQEPDYDSHTAWVCANCLRAALALLEPANAEAKRRPR